MKRIFLKSSLALFVIILIPMPAPALPYAIDWYTVDDGGAMNVTGGTYSLSGTIGQQDAEPALRGGNYALDGGSRGLFAFAGATPDDRQIRNQCYHQLAFALDRFSTGTEQQPAESKRLGRIRRRDQ